MRVFVVSLMAVVLVGGPALFADNDEFFKATMPQTRPSEVLKKELGHDRTDVRKHARLTGDDVRAKLRESRIRDQHPQRVMETFEVLDYEQAAPG